MVVVSITALVAGLIFPAISQTLDLLALRQGTTVFVANLRAVRAGAMRSGQRGEVAVADDGRGYAWIGGGVSSIGRDVRVAPAGARIGFYPDGSSTGGAFSLTGAGRQTVVTVDAATGAARVGR